MERAEEAQEHGETEDSGRVYEDHQFKAGETMTMAEALAKSKGEDGDMETLNRLNKEGMNSALGPLFEYGTG